MTSKTSRVRSAGASRLCVVAALCALPGPTAAQLGHGDAFWMAAGGELSLAGTAASAATPPNPAALAGATGWAFSLSPARLDLSLGPVTGRDIVRAGDGVLSRARREAWLDRIGTGLQRGGVDAGLGPISVRRGSVALDVATSVFGRSRLPADAVELLLFGNAGRDGQPGDFALAGSALDGAVWTRVGVAFGARPDPAAQPRLSVGVRLHATIGHALVVTRDAGSVIVGNDATASLLLPTIATGGGEAFPGFGVGVDVGFTWRSAGGVTGLALENAASSFGWSDSALRYRAGETLIEGEGVETDFDARPVSEAPPTLRALARRLRPARRIDVEHVRGVTDAVRLRVSVRERIERGLAPGRPDARLVGVEWKARRWLELAGHGGVVDGRGRLGTGVRIALGAWLVSAGWSIDRGDGLTGSAMALSVGR